MVTYRTVFVNLYFFRLKTPPEKSDGGRNNFGVADTDAFSQNEKFHPLMAFLEGGMGESSPGQNQYAMATIRPPMPLPCILSTDTITSRAARVTFTVASPPL